MKALFPGQLLLLLFLAGSSNQGFAQLTLIQTVEVSGNLHTSDYLGNLYVVSGSVLTRYDLNGRIDGTFRSVMPGNIDLVDASNPFQVILFYRDYNRMTIVDRNLVQTGQDIYLSSLGIGNAESVSFSARGGIWVLDWSLRRIVQFDQNFRRINQVSLAGILFRNEDFPLYMTERDGDLYVSFSSGGLWKFDRLGAYKNISSQDRIRHFHVTPYGIIFVAGGEIIILDPLSGNQQHLVPQIGGPILSARQEGDFLIVFTSGRIYVYKSE